MTRLSPIAFLVFTAGLVLATPPTPPWGAWERIARTEGAAAVRDHYRQALDETQRQLRQLPSEPSEEVYGQRLILAATMIDYIESWSLVESRDLHAAREGKRRFTETVWPEIINYTSNVLGFCDELNRQSHIVRATRAADEETHWSVTLSAGMHKNVDRLGYELALLGRIADDDTPVRQLFTLFGGKIGAHVSADEFLAAEHDVSRAIGDERPTNAREPRVDAAVDPALEESARAFIGEFFAAINHRDDSVLTDLIAHLEYPVSLTGRELVTQLARADTSGARFSFAMLKRDEIVARIKGVVTARGDGHDANVHVRNLALRFRIADDGLKLLSIGGL